MKPIIYEQPSDGFGRRFWHKDCAKQGSDVAMQEISYDEDKEMGVIFCPECNEQFSIPKGTCNGTHFLEYAEQLRKGK